MPADPQAAYSAATPGFYVIDRETGRAVLGPMLRWVDAANGMWCRNGARPLQVVRIARTAAEEASSG